MAHLYRFFGEKMSDGKWRLEDDEVVHALKVLRLQDGAPIEVMDGLGRVGVGKLVAESKSKAIASDVSETMAPKDAVTRSVLIGALKPGDVDDLIAPLIELGIDRILVFRQDDTPHFRVNDNSSERWQRLVRSAVKQSKRPWAVSVEAFDSLDLALEKIASAAHRWLLSPDSSQDLIEITKDLGDASVELAALVGGEKGLSPREEKLALSQGFKPVRLGPWVLRARTAAPAVAVFLGMLPRKK